MASVTTVAIAVAMGGGVLLMVAGIGHARRFDQLRAVLVGQALVPYRWHRPLAHTLVVAELIVGFAALVAVPTLLASEASVVFAVEAGVYFALLGYSGILRIRRPTAPCGCFGDDGPVSLPSLARTAVLALGASTAAAATASPTAHAVAPLPLLAVGAFVVAVLAYAASVSKLVGFVGLEDQQTSRCRARGWSF